MLSQKERMQYAKSITLLVQSAFAAEVLRHPKGAVLNTVEIKNSIAKRFLNDVNTTIDACKKYDRTSELARLNVEKLVLTAMLPKQLTQNEIFVIVKREGFADVKSAQKYFKEHHTGEYNGKNVTHALVALNKEKQQ